MHFRNLFVFYQFFFILTISLLPLSTLNSIRDYVLIYFVEYHFFPRMKKEATCADLEVQQNYRWSFFNKFIASFYKKVRSPPYCCVVLLDPRFEASLLYTLEY